ncbi:hypothetical protein Tco_1035067, partial [Tanacetum coccineum]
TCRSQFSDCGQGNTAAWKLCGLEKITCLTEIALLRADEKHYVKNPLK